MDLDKVLEIRKSCRKYNPKKELTQEQINKILWAGSRAPYGSGGPRCEIITITLPETKIQLMKNACFKQPYVGSCSTVFVICGKYVPPEKKNVLRSGHSKYVFDVSAATMCMDLMATSMGLGTCWIGWFEANKVKEIVQTEHKPTIILLVGHKRDE